jgi:lysophospholipid acyltransferase (LPLAT)-like uncharacterized protein
MTPKITRLAELVRQGGTPAHLSAPAAGRNSFTRSLDRLLLKIRRYLPPLHWMGAAASGLAMFTYAWLVGRTTRLITAGARKWPDIPDRCVLAIWHGSAPSLMAALAVSKPRLPITIMIATEPRGDALTVLCRLLGLQVIRGDWEHHGWPAVTRMANAVGQGSCAVITPDGGGPRCIARAGALVLAAAANVPLVAIGAECRPAIAEPHKWDQPHNPVPFGRIAISIEEPLHLAELRDASDVESARIRLQEALDRAHQVADVAANARSNVT